MKNFSFPCGCSFPIKKDLGPDKVPLCEFNKDSYREDCPAVWKLFAEGRTLGVFQLEKGLGQTWSKELRPTTIEHLAILGAILRPGTLNSLLDDGESITKHYCNRKNMKEPAEQPIKALEPLLRNTYQLMIFQEDVIRIGQEIAGFTLGEADYYLRKAIGRKDARLLFETEEKFISGAKNVGKVTEEEAKTIFTSMKASARYSFNKCLHQLTILTTKSGNKKLYQINIGDYVLASKNAIEWDTEWVQVKNIYTSNTNVVSVVFETGKNIICSLNHKFYCVNAGMQPLWAIVHNGFNILGEGYTYEHIVSINPIGKHVTIDLEVDSPNHNFIANSLVVSNSHATQYGIHSFQEMYLKAHHVLHFYTSKLKSPRKSTEQEDIANLIYDAKNFNIKTKLPDVRHLRPKFYNDGKSIYFGLTNIKDFGPGAYTELVEVMKDGKDKILANPFEFMVNSARKLSPSLVRLLIESGSVDFFGLSRTQLLDEFDLIAGLTSTEQDKLFKFYDATKAGVLFDGPTELITNTNASLDGEMM